MATFLITAPDGKKYKVTGENAEGAHAALMEMLGEAPQTTQPAQPEVSGLQDVAQAAAGGVMRGAVSTLALPEMAARAIRRGGEEVYQAFGGEVKEETPILETYTEELARGIIGAVPLAEEIMEYEPQTTTGKFFGTAAEFVGGAGAAGGVGRLAAKGAKKLSAKKVENIAEGLAKTGLTKEAQAAAITAGVASEAAGQATEGTELEPYARVAGAIAAPTVVARSFNLAAKPYDTWVKPRQIYDQVKTGNEAVDLTLSRAIAKPSKETQKAFKDTAYREVDKIGDTFSQDDLMGLAENTRAKLYQGVAGNKLDITPQGKFRGEGHIKQALDIIDEYTDAPSTLSNLDNMRQRIRTVWKRGEDGARAFDPRIKEILDDIDRLIETKTVGSELLSAARLGHIRTKKLEILEDALEAADREVKSGASITKRYQAALKKISTQKRSKSYFTDVEIDAMDRILEGQIDDKILRQFGKLSPFNGFNMMTILGNLGPATLYAAGNPAALGITAASIISKPISDAVIKGQVRELNRFLATGAAPTKMRPPLSTRAYGLTPQIPQE